MSRIVTVFGATGTQGSSVITALLANTNTDPNADRTFTPRAVTRNIHSDRAKELEARGVQVVCGDLSDRESVRRVVEGSECVFGVTNTADSASLAKGLGLGLGLEFEIEQGKNLVDACKDAGVKFFVWSSLPSISKLSNGKYNQVAPFENKAIIDEYLRTSGVPYAILHTGQSVHLLQPTSIHLPSILHPPSIHPSYVKIFDVDVDVYGYGSAGFAENIFNQYLQKVSTPTPSPSGPAYEYELVLLRTPSSATLPIVWIGRDLGLSVLALLRNYRHDGKKELDEQKELEGKEGEDEDESEMRVLGQTFTIVSEVIGVEEIVEVVGEAIGKPITFRELETSGMPTLDELFDFFKEFDYTSTMKVDPRLVALGVRPSTFREFAEVELKPRYA